MKNTCMLYADLKKCVHSISKIDKNTNMKDVGSRTVIPEVLSLVKVFNRKTKSKRRSEYI